MRLPAAPAGRPVQRSPSRKRLPHRSARLSTSSLERGCNPRKCDSRSCPSCPDGWLRPAYAFPNPAPKTKRCQRQVNGVFLLSLLVFNVLLRHIIDAMPRRSIACTFGLAGIALVVGLAAQQQPTPQQQERQRLAQQDRQRIMDLLGIKSIPPGAQSANPETYDESKADPFPALPHPLFMNDGRRVTSVDMWWKQRRPETVEDFEREVYGRTPKDTPRVRWEVTNTVKDARTTTKTLVGHVDNSSYPAVTVDIQLTLTTPADAAGPVPVIMQLNFPFTGRARGAAAPAAGATSSTPPPASWQQQVLARGWGWAQI